MTLRALSPLAAVALFLCAGFCRLCAQGGPPMITDDPGTPGDRMWEVNIAWTDQRVPGASHHELPLLDANYGIGDRIELNYVTAWDLDRDGSGSSSGLEDTQLAVKWRFLDQGDKGWQMSVFPRVTFPTPGSDADRRGLTDASTSVLLPVEIQRQVGPLSLGVDVGRISSTHADEDGWMGGVLLGREVLKGWELDGEYHENTGTSLDHREGILNAGTRLAITEHCTLMGAVGRDLSNTMGPRSSLLVYLGVQLTH